MKNLLVIIMLVLIAQTGVAQNVPSYVPTNGLVGWWPFNGNANDESGNGNDGVVNGANLTSDRFGNFNRAYSFNSNPQNITFPNLHQNNILNYSVVGWFQINQLNGGGTIISGDVPLQSPSGLRFALANSNHFTWQVEDGWNTNGILNNSSNNVNYNDNTWHSFAVTFNSNPGLIDASAFKVYTDGVLMPSVTFQEHWPPGSGFSMGFNVYAPVDNGTLPVVLGNANDLAAIFKGNLDDIAIYNRALTQQEITNLYNASTTPPSPCPTLPANLQTGLVGYWPFCGNANDESGNGNNGTVGDGVTMSNNRYGNSSSAYSFNGNGNILLSSLPTTGSQNFTISAWVLTNNVANTKAIASWGQDVPWGGAFFFITQNGHLKFDFAYNGGPQSTQVITDSFWHFVCVTNSNGSIQLFVDGVPTGPVYQMTPNIIGTNKILGGGFNSTENNFRGSLDDICIWNRALDSTEISQLYQTQSSDANNGNVGVNVIAPQRNLHVKDVIRLEPRSTPPDNPVFGDIYIDAVLKKLRVYDGTTGQNCW